MRAERIERLTTEEVSVSNTPSRPLALLPSSFRDGRHRLDEAALLTRYTGADRPFTPNDVTAGSETELQVAVQGRPHEVDLPIELRHSHFFLNLQARVAAGESPPRLVAKLRDFLDRNPTNLWENSWVRVPIRVLGHELQTLFASDCAADKSRPEDGLRLDHTRFLVQHQDEPCLRIPISYVLKLALLHTVGREVCPSPALRETGHRFANHFLNDNSSPETLSFHISPLHPDHGLGAAVAGETAKRLLLSHLLILYANRRFELQASGQRALIYLAPHPPIRQKQLNGLISDNLYRELFMNPCLSGWDNGYAKLQYMHLCHQVLSRSQLNAMITLRDQGIIARNLVVLPSTSNISLANNGTHLSLGSRRLTGLLADPSSGFTAKQEKWVGDLVIKIVEHFLPLFVGTYSAAPYRLDFGDFHPERALGFLPHELEGTHLRMLWRRWKKKARLSIFGQPLTPLGPAWLDRLVSTTFGLRGDLVPDFRLIDYLVALLSTDQSPALDGTLGNDTGLKRDLAQQGVFDESMSLYLLLKLRRFESMGFSGFEGRHYSLFDDLTDDMGNAATLQALLIGLAFQLIATGVVRHTDIPDDPTTESERRQVLFGAALGLPAFNVRTAGPNRFLDRILARTAKTRSSRRHPDHLRVRVADYRMALLETIRAEAPDLIERFGAHPMLEDLEQRLREPERAGVAGKLTAGILAECGARQAWDLTGDEFNGAAETYYRGTLRRRHIRKAIQLVIDDLTHIDAQRDPASLHYRQLISTVIGTRGAAETYARAESGIVEEELDDTALRECIWLTLLTLQRDGDLAAPTVQRRAS